MVKLKDRARAQSLAQTTALALERGFLLTLRTAGGWMSAGEVAAAHGLAWHSVSFVLRRLAEQGLLEEDVHGVRGKVRSVEHQRVYRARAVLGHNRRVTDLPAWMAPQAVVAIGVPTMVEGEAGFRRWEQQDADRRAAPHPMRRKSDHEGPVRRSGTDRRRSVRTLAWRVAVVLAVALLESPDEKKAVATREGRDG